MPSIRAMSMRPTSKITQTNGHHLVQTYLAHTAFLESFLDVMPHSLEVVQQEEEYDHNHQRDGDLPEPATNLISLSPFPQNQQRLTEDRYATRPTT